MNTGVAAQAYAAKGWHVLPVALNKRPVGRLVPRGLRDATTDAATIDRWFQLETGAGVGVVVPAGVVIVDVDPRNGGDATLVALEAAHGKLPATLEAETGGGGAHFWFSVPADVGRLRGKLGPGVDVKLPGAGYVVAPPSAHASGRVYRWRDETATPVPAPAWLLALLVERSGADAPALSVEPESGPGAPCLPLGAADRVSRASAWLERAEPAVSGQRGHAKAFAVVERVVRGFRLSDVEALDALTDWNARCRPPWSQPELLHKIRDGRERGDTATGDLSDRPRSAEGISHDVERAAIRAEPAADVADDPKPGPTVDDPLRGLTHLSKIALVGRENILARAAEPVPYVWSDIAVAATIVVIAGGVGEGKTTLLFLILAARMNVGDPISLLGRQVVPAPPGKFVVLIEGEHGEGSTSRKLVRSCETLGLETEALERVIVVARKAVRIGSVEWADVTKLVAAGLVSDIAIDTLARCAPADSNSETEQVAIFDTVSRTIDAAPSEVDKPIVWVAAHRRKGGDFDLDAVSGSAQRTGQADSVLLVVGERVGGRVTKTDVGFWKLREDPERYPEPVSFSIVVGADGRRAIEYQGADAAEPPEDQPLEVTITSLLGKGAQTKTALAKATGRSWADVDRAISNLFSSREIRSTVTKVRGQACKAFELAQASSNSGHKRPDERPDESLLEKGPTKARPSSGQNAKTLQNKSIADPTKARPSSGQRPDPDGGTLEGFRVVGPTVGPTTIEGRGPGGQDGAAELEEVHLG